MNADELISTLHHLHSCHSCQNQINYRNPIKSRVDSLLIDLQPEIQSSEFHLSYEQLAGYVDGSLDQFDSQEVSKHLSCCTDCFNEIRSLTELHESLAALPAITVPAIRKESAWQKGINFWRSIGFTRSRQITAFATIIVLLIGALIWQRQYSKPLLRQEEARRVTPDTIPQSRAETPVNIASPPLPSLTPAAIVASLIDHGQQITLDRDGRIKGLANLKATDEEAIKTALRQQRIPHSSLLHELSNSSGTLMGRQSDHPAFELLQPIATVVQPKRPVFRWQALTGATGYRVTILDADFNVVITSERLNQTQWIPPQSLERGKLYLWQVTAQAGSQELISSSAATPEARFRILSEPQAAQLKTAAQQYANSHLALGVIYAQEGLLDDAEHEFQALLKSSPHSKIPPNLLRDLRALRQR